jgi:pimeloyl-ACP methyl ester carboxylesterase
VHQERPSPYEVTTPGGRLAVEISGDPNGIPVFLLHGMPGSRNGPKPRPSVLYRLGVRLISYDRPGYGSSTRRRGRTVADAAHDVAAIADNLRLDRFAVAGRSGGGPHALACAAVLTDRVVRTAALVSVAPPDAAGLDWFSGMTDDNTYAYTAAGVDSSSFAKQLRRRARRAVADPDGMLNILRGEMTEADSEVVKNFALRRMLYDTFNEGLKGGADGWIDDVLALRKEWAFDLDAIKGPVRLWHGEQDNFAPVSHSLWLAEHIPNADIDIEVQPQTAHFAAVQALMEILPWLIDWPHFDRSHRDAPLKPAAAGGSVRHHP